MAKKAVNNECGYKFSDEVEVITLRIPDGKDEKGNPIFIEKKGKAVYPFGVQNKPIFESDLTDSMAEFMLSRENLKKFISKKK